MKKTLFSKSNSFNEQLIEDIRDLSEIVEKIVDSDSQLRRYCQLWKQICSLKTQELRTKQATLDVLPLTNREIKRYTTEAIISVVFRLTVLVKTNRERAAIFTDVQSIETSIADARTTKIGFLYQNDMFDIWKCNLFQGSLPEVNLKIEQAIPPIIAELSSMLPEIVPQIIHQQLLSLKQRKALGEVYTPRSISEIIGGLSIKNTSMPKTIIDLSSGAGSLLMKAVRLLDSETSSDACNLTQNIVGIDINPIAVLMCKCIICLFQFEKSGSLSEICEPHIFCADSLISYAQLSLFDGGDMIIELMNEEHHIGGFEDLFLFNIREIHKGKERTLAEVRSTLDQNLTTILDLDGSEIQSSPALFKWLQDDFCKGYKKELILDRICAQFAVSLEYDLVVGNPPYARVQSINPKWKRKLLKRVYHSATGHFDLYYQFIELGIDLMAEEGKMVYITSNKFMYTRAGRSLRHIISKNTVMTDLIDFCDSHVFNAAVLPVIFTLSKNSNNSQLGYTSLRKVNGSEKALPREISVEKLIHVLLHFEPVKHDLLNIGAQHAVKMERFNSSIPQSAEKPWIFLNDHINSCLRNIESNSASTLGEISKKIIVGIKTTANYAFIDDFNADFMQRPSVKQFRKNIRKKYGSNCFFPVIQGSMIRNYRIGDRDETGAARQYIFYPHHKENGRLIPFPEKDIQFMLHYFHERNYAERMKKRGYMKKAGRKWYEIWNTKDPDDMSVCPKIVVPDISNKNNFAIDHHGHYVDGSAYFIILANSREEYHRYIIGLLNSYVAEFYHKLTSGNTLYAKRYRYWSTTIKDIPIVPFNESPRVLVDKLVGLIEKIEKDYSEATEKAINEIVFEIYGLEPDKRRLIKDWVREHR